MTVNGAPQPEPEALQPGEAWFLITVLLAGLIVDQPIVLPGNVRVEEILPSNLIAKGAREAADAIFHVPAPDEEARPVYGLRFRVRGRHLMTGDDWKFTNEQIEAPKRAFLRAVALMQAQELADAGTFVAQEDADGNAVLRQWQFNYGRLSVHYEAVHLGEWNAVDLASLFTALLEPYFHGTGTGIGVAIDRLGVAEMRASKLDTNLDLCIASEIAFLFGVKDMKNELIGPTVRENARVFFGDGEFFWDREKVDDIIKSSYKERSNTVHGRKFGDSERLGALIGLNAQLREVLKGALRAYVERRPTKLQARKAWKDRQVALGDGHPLPPIFLTPNR